MKEKSCKPQAPQYGQIHMIKKRMKFIFEGRTYQFKNMEEANAELPLGDGAWFGPKDGNVDVPANTHRWVEGNFFD